jgi:hypothetical protein
LDISSKRGFTEYKNLIGAKAPEGVTIIDKIDELWGSVN